VGREREMEEVKRELAMTRLLTLTGVGGSGKTRLALEVARDLIEAYPDGVWLVQLAPLSEEVLVPKAVAEALGVIERPGESLTDTLTDVLRNKQLLLVVDNCEHLVGAAAGHEPSTLLRGGSNDGRLDEPPENSSSTPTPRVSPTRWTASDPSSVERYTLCSSFV
jgi:predicted ATPase